MRLRFKTVARVQEATGDRGLYTISIDEFDDWVARWEDTDPDSDHSAQLYEGPDKQLALDACQEYEDE